LTREEESMTGGEELPTVEEEKLMAGGEEATDWRRKRVDDMRIRSVNDQRKKG